MGRILTEKDVEAAVKGGSVYAAGGGGWADHGRMLGTAACRVGKPELVAVEELPEDAWIATAAAIGAPAGTTAWEMQGIDYVRAAQLLEKELGEKLSGLIIGQNGRSSTLNAWLPSAVMGTKVVDAVGDIRAHPTGDMGSIGLAGSPERMIQTAVGGNRDENRYIELVVKGATAKVSPILRTASDMSGGFIASCRNPVRASYVRQHAALGGISLALRLGEAIIAAEARGGHAVIDTICKTTGGSILVEGEIVAKDVTYTREAFDIGTITLKEGGRTSTLHVMNEYMAVDDGEGRRIATFPDVITSLDPNGEPLSVGQLHVGQRIFVLHVPKTVIPLSSSVLDPSVYPAVEKAMGIEIASYALAK
ncbi:DUF917 domain-containing protein [Microvirga pudoricolor]|uniref:DUF917 domain-containing protein n=1 Tax=Microvirga pudoricolor TaxID=2778729 RepID=UPI00194F8C8E|nr:DUF917 domain-containing protein [Microvirga pudoricolor]MBM6592826.1 DUF917 family protein [Microvirga pudoricolor]